MPALVGRAPELRILEEELKRAAAGPPRCVLIIADAGVGKTRLAGHFVARHARDATELVARGNPLGATTPFGLWIEALERNLRDRSPDDIRRLCRGVVSDVAPILRSVAAVAGETPAHEPPRARILEAIATVIDGLATERPVIVHLDDFHDADVSSAEALAYAMRTVTSDGVLVVLAARPGDLDSRPELTDLVSALEQDGVLRRIVLAPFGRTELGALASSITHVTSVPEGLLSWLEDRSQGNALFAVGLLQALVDDGGDIAAPALRHIPATLAARVEARIQRLDEPVRATLETLAVLGTPVEFSDLLLIAARPPERLAPILEELVRQRLVVEEERGPRLAHSIAHPLIRDVIYQRIGAARRHAMHRLVARALLSGGRLAEAAPHFARSAVLGDDEAITAIREAIGQSERRELHREALLLLDALADLIPPGDARWVEVLDAMPWDAEWVIDHRADTYAAVGLRALMEIRHVLAARGDEARLGTVELRLASFTGWGQRDPVEGLAHAERAVEHFERAGQPGAARMAAHEVGYQHHLAGEYELHAAVARDVLRSAEAAGDRVMAMEALGSLAIALLGLGDNEAAHDALVRSAEIAETDGKRYRLTWNRTFIAMSLAFMGRVTDARQVMARAMAEDQGYRETMIVEVDSLVAWLAGDLPGAVARALDSATQNSTGLSGRRAWVMAVGAVAERDRGRPAEAHRHLARAASVYGTRTFGWCSGYRYWAEGVLALGAGDFTGAEASLLDAVADWGGAHRVAVHTSVGLALADLVDAALSAGKRTTAELAASQLHSMAAAVGGDLLHGLDSLSAARMHLSAGAQAAAGSAAAEAALRFSRGGMQLLEARAHDVRGTAEASSDRAAAADALGRAVRLYTACGADARRADALARLARLDERGRRAAATLNGEPLSPREQEVARLASDGLTARQIGERLFIGHRTVETHLASVYAKLGVSSRVELARRLASVDS